MRVEIVGLSFRYPSGVLALDGIDLAIESGEAVAIVGENGAGKTTLARHLNGLLRPQSGTIRIGDWDTRDKTVAQLARRVGYVFQNPDDQLFARTVRDEVAFGPKNLGLSGADLEQAVAWAVDTCRLTGAAAQNPYDLAAQERKFVAVAATLAMRTPIVILDEPTTGLDASGLVRLAEIVNGLKARRVTLLTISHDLDFCAEHFSRTVVLSRGRVLADGPTGTVMRQAETLRSAQVRPPQLIRLAVGLGMLQTPCTVEEFTAAYAEHIALRSKGPCSSSSAT